jgi:hypothetical protein
MGFFLGDRPMLDPFRYNKDLSWTQRDVSVILRPSFPHHLRQLLRLKTLRLGSIPWHAIG